MTVQPEEKRVYKMVTLTETLDDYAEQMVAEFGLGSFAELVRFLVLNAVWQKKKAIPLVSAEEEAEIAEGVDDINSGRFETISPGDTRALSRVLRGRKK